MRFSENFLNELKDRLPLSSYVGRKVKLTRSGRHMKGLSPFKQEKTPSFFVDDDKRTFTCYSTGVHGDLISFVQETEGLSFQEAVEKLAGMAGMELPTDSPQERQQVAKRKSLMELMEATVTFYENQLRADIGREARDYLLNKRGLDDPAWRRHRIGYAPEGWQSLRDHLVGLGANDKELLDIGVVRTSKQSSKPPYDAFRHRIIFPILDPTGRPVALGGRALEPSEVLKEKGIPKYVNSAETPLFHKSSVIYNYGRARDALHKKGMRQNEAGDALSRGLIVSEGYMDVIALAEHGFDTAVAPMGTALTEDHLKMLWRVGPEPIMCFDGDAAGRNAALRAADLALPLLEPGNSLYFTLLPQGMDPDDLLKTDGGKEQMRDLLLNARPLVDLLWERERDKEKLDTPERRAGFEARLDACADRIGHEQVKKAYRRELKNRQFELFRPQRQPFVKGGFKKPTSAGITWEQIMDAQGRSGIGLLVRAIDSQDLLEEARDVLAFAEFSDQDVSSLRNAALDVQESHGKVDRLLVAAHLRSLGRTRSAKLLEDYPRNEPIDPASGAGRAWLEALERFPTVAALRDEADSTKDAVASANGVEEYAAEWARRKRLVAEREALRKRTQETEDDQYSRE